MLCWGYDNFRGVDNFRKIEKRRKIVRGSSKCQFSRSSPTLDFILYFRKNKNSANLPLSPLPSVRHIEFSPRRLSTKHSIFISPHKTNSKSNDGSGKNLIVNYYLVIFQRFLNSSLSFSLIIVWNRVRHHNETVHEIRLLSN